MKYIAAGFIFLLGMAFGEAVAVWSYPSKEELTVLKMTQETLRSNLDQNFDILNQLQHKITELKMQLEVCKTPPMYAKF